MFFEEIRIPTMKLMVAGFCRKGSIKLLLSFTWDFFWTFMLYKPKFPSTGLSTVHSQV